MHYYVRMRALVLNTNVDTTHPAFNVAYIEIGVH